MLVCTKAEGAHERTAATRGQQVLVCLDLLQEEKCTARLEPVDSIRPVMSYPCFPRFSSPRLTHVQRGPAEKHTQTAGEGPARPEEIPQTRASRGWTRYSFEPFLFP